MSKLGTDCINIIRTSVIGKMMAGVIWGRGGVATLGERPELIDIKDVGNRVRERISPQGSRREFEPSGQEVVRRGLPPRLSPSGRVSRVSDSGWEQAPLHLAGLREPPIPVRSGWC